MSKNIDFISQPTPVRLRKEIQNICDSYSHPWDVLAELTQNSVDAIRMHRIKYGESSRKHAIELIFNQQNRSITIRDTGIGISCDDYANLLAPHGTDKDVNDHRVVGHKGVGLTYVIFSSNKFSLRSTSISGNLEVSIDRAKSWKIGAIDHVPKMQVIREDRISNNPDATSTEIVVADLEAPYTESDDLFVQSLPIIEFLIRTKTAIGSTKPIFHVDENPIEIILAFEAADGVTTRLRPKFLYQSPQEFVSGKDIIDLDDFRSKAATMSDEQKRVKLQGKVLRVEGSKMVAGRGVKYHGLFVPTRSTWAKICEKNGLMLRGDDGEMAPVYQGAIHISTRGMPTGIELPQPVRGNAGYWPNFYLLLEDDSLQFDLGRKSIPGRTQGRLKEIARELFNEVTKFAGYVAAEPNVQLASTVLSYEKSRTFDELLKLGSGSV